MYANKDRALDEGSDDEFMPGFTGNRFPGLPSALHPGAQSDTSTPSVTQAGQQAGQQVGHQASFIPTGPTMAPSSGYTSSVYTATALRPTPTNVEIPLPAMPVRGRRLIPPGTPTGPRGARFTPSAYATPYTPSAYATPSTDQPGPRSAPTTAEISRPAMPNSGRGMVPPGTPTGPRAMQGPRQDVGILRDLQPSHSASAIGSTGTQAIAPLHPAPVASAIEPGMEFFARDVQEAARIREMVEAAGFGLSLFVPTQAYPMRVLHGYNVFSARVLKRRHEAALDRQAHDQQIREQNQPASLSEWPGRERFQVANASPGHPLPVPQRAGGGQAPHWDVQPRDVREAMMAQPTEEISREALDPFMQAAIEDIDRFADDKDDDAQPLHLRVKTDLEKAAEEKQFRDTDFREDA